jgi:hypothetical protein
MSYRHGYCLPTVYFDLCEIPGEALKSQQDDDPVNIVETTNTVLRLTRRDAMLQ